MSLGSGGALLVLAALCLGACRGETVYLGDDPGADGGVPDAEPCSERDHCDNPERPFCNLETERCVECLDDWQCPSGRCRYEERAGVCVWP